MTSLSPVKDRELATNDDDVISVVDEYNVNSSFADDSEVQLSELAPEVKHVETSMSDHLQPPDGGRVSTDHPLRIYSRRHVQ